MRFSIFFTLFVFPAFCFGQVAGYPVGVEKITFKSSGDQSDQPALFWSPEVSEGESVPLLVALHTWSNDFEQAGGEAVYAKWCQQVGWAFVHPDFRGPNTTPEAMGSDLAVADVLSSIEFAKKETKIDPNRIYCIGVSGGGHMSLMMAGRAPDLWAGVSAWCGISDIRAWHQQCSDNKQFKKYAQHIEKVLGPFPEGEADKAKWLAAAAKRSPVTWLERAKSVNLDINHGVNDGRAGSVPFTHSFAAWNAVVPQHDQFPVSVVETFYKTRQFTEQSTENDPLYGTRQPVFRKISGNTRLTLFDGGHEMVHEPALNWLAAQRKGEPAVWSLKNQVTIDTSDKDAESGK